MEFSWAENYPDLQKMCKQFSMVEISHPTRFKYKELPSIIQEGPTCGLVALAMCCLICDEEAAKENKDLVKEIFEEAQKRKYTNNGEMFSACQMKELTDFFLKNTFSLISLYEGRLNSDYVIDFLSNGGLILVPYDTSGNHYPGKFNGDKAHWAAISGLIQTSTSNYVIAKQGKSARLMIWDLKELDESNAQLFEVSWDRLNSELDYIVPEGGLKGKMGLNEKSIFILPP